MPPRALTDLQELEVRARYEAGESIDRLADRFGIARATVHRILGDTPRRPQGRRPASGKRCTVADADVIRLREVDGLSWRLLGEAIGLSPIGARTRYMAALARRAA